MTRAAVLLTGAIAAAIVARTAAFYRGVDALAFDLVLLIGLGLALGVIEGLLRAGRAARLVTEIVALPAPATKEAVEAASPPLRAFLLARLAGSPAAPAAAPFTPYLLGLLVMIGLLGTFLGLFETLRGAREALSASADVAALRAGLAAPMSGLSRAFGTSAAGVSASAMLGLGAVFVRRAEGRVVEALARYAAGPLAAITVAGRQLAALEALARHGEALPAAAEALREATSRLAQLEAHLTAAQAKAGVETAAAIRGTAAEIRADLDRGMGRAAEAVTAVVEPLVARAVERAGAVAGASMAGFAQRMDRDAEERRDRDAAHARALEEAVDAAQGRAAEADAARLRVLGDAVAGVRAELGAAGVTAAAQGEAFAAQVERATLAVGRIEGASEARLAAQVERLAAAMRVEAARFEEAHAARARDAALRVGELEVVFAAQLDALGQRLSQPIADAVRAAQVSSEAAARLVEGAGARLESRALADAVRDGRIDALIAALGDTAGRVGAGVETQASRLDALANAAEARAAGSEARAEERLARLAAAVQRAVSGQDERLAAFESRLEQERGAGAEALAARLGDHARGLGESLGATAALVEGASDLLRAGSAEMVSVAEMFTLAVDRYREASDRWLDNLGVIEDAIARKDGTEAADVLGAYLAQTREVFDYSLQFQRELFTELRALRARTSS